MAAAVPEAAMLVRDLVNTYEPQTGEEAWSSIAAFRAWSGEHGLDDGSARLTEGDLGRLKDLREGLRAVLLAHAGHDADPARLRRMEEVVAASAPRVRLSAEGARFLPGAGVAGRVVGLVLDAVLRSEVDGTWQRLKVCERDTCRWAYYDASRNGSRRWCSMEGCGNVLKMRRRAGRSALTTQ